MAYKIINNNKKFIYVHIPKTGGTTIEQVLGGDTSGKLRGHISLKDVKKRLDDYNECISFTTVRNPWDLYVSNYHYLRQKNVNDPDFAREYPILNQNSFSNFIKFIYDNRNDLVFVNDGDNTLKWQQMLEWGYDGEKYVDYFIKVEELSEKKLREVGLDIKYTHTKTNISKHNHYSTYYDDVTKEIVRDMHKDDIEYFNYKF